MNVLPRVLSACTVRSAVSLIKLNKEVLAFMRRIIILFSLLFLMSALGCSRPKDRPEDAPVVSPTAEASAETVEEAGNGDADENAFSSIAGVWKAENAAFPVLTVYVSGGFLLERENEKAEGYLSVRESDGSAEYDMYLENNTPYMNNAHLTVDESHPGKLALIIGMGAELLLPVDPMAGSAIEVRWATEEETKSPSLTTVDVMLGEAGETIHLSAKETVYDFRVLALDFEGFSSDGEIAYITSDYYHLEQLDEGGELLVRPDPFENIPRVGFTYDDAEGKSRYFAIGMSGKDGSLYLDPFWE